MPGAPVQAESGGPRGAPKANGGRSPRPAWPLAVFLTLSAFVAFIWYFAISAHEAAVLQERSRELQAIAELKIDHIAEWIEERRRDARIAALSPEIAEAIDRASQGAPVPPAADVAARLEEIRWAYGYEAVVLLDANARPQLSAGLLRENARIGQQNAAREAMRRREVIVADHYNDSPGSEHMDVDVVAPVAVPGRDGPRVIGALALHINADRHVFPELRRWPSPSQTAEALLVGRAGDELIHLTPLRHRAEFRLRRPSGDPGLPAAMVARGQHGMAEGTDYRGMRVLAAIGQVPGTSWGLVAKVDRDEVLAPVRRQALGSGALALGLLAAMGFATRLWRRRAQAEFQIAEQESVERALRESEASLANAQAIAHVGSWRLDIQADLLTWSDETHHIFGVPPNTPLNLERFLACVHPDDRTLVIDAWNAAVAGTPYDLEHRILIGDEVKWVRELAEVRLDSAGQPAIALGAVQDITDRKEEEQKRLEFARQQRDTLVKEVHHRIKNHLQGLAGLLRQHIFRYPALKEPVEAIVAQIGAIAIVHGLQGREKTGEVRIAALVHEIVAFLGGRTAVPIKAEVPPCATACSVADEESIPVALILNELVTNALRHGWVKPGAGVSITVHCVAEGTAITVQNPGHCPAGLDFAAGKGLGTGLTLVKSLLPQSGATVSIGPGPEGLVDATLKLSAPVLIRSAQCPATRQPGQASMPS